MGSTPWDSLVWSRQVLGVISRSIHRPSALSASIRVISLMAALLCSASTTRLTTSLASFSRSFTREWWWQSECSWRALLSLSVDYRSDGSRSLISGIHSLRSHARFRPPVPSPKFRKSTISDLRRSNVEFLRPFPPLFVAWDPWPIILFEKWWKIRANVCFGRLNHWNWVLRDTWKGTNARRIGIRICLWWLSQ